MLILSLILSALPRTILAAEPPLEPKEVHVGVFVKQFHGISLKDSQLVVDFHVWFRWKDPELKPLETFELVNGTIQSKENPFQLEVKGFHYASCRVVATLHKVWDVTRYPLDSHDVSLEIEDSEFEIHKLIYVADVENSGLSPDAVAAGWTLGTGQASVRVHTDRTNYGDISLPSDRESSWSRFTFAARLSRPGPGIFFKLLTGLFVATAIAVHGILIPPIQIDARLSLAVGAIFAAVASEYLVASGLPETNELTLADRLHIVSFLLIFVTLSESIVAYKLALGGKEKLARRIDLFCFCGFLLAYFGMSFLIIRW